MISILSYLRQGEYMLAIIMLLSRVFVVFCCMPIHECAHAFAAHILGDDTAKNRGRLTLNPLSHLNPIGAIMILLVGFGYAEAVPVNPRNFKNQKFGMAITSLAGPLSNILMGWLSIWGVYIVYRFMPASSLSMALNYFFSFSAQVNVILAVFNLIPVPPLDGSKIAAIILPDRIYNKYMQYERYFIYAVFLLIITGILDVPIQFLTNGLIALLSIVPKFLFGI